MKENGEKKLEMVAFSGFFTYLSLESHFS